MSTDEDNTATMVTDLATATELIHAVAREAGSTAPTSKQPTSTPWGPSWTS